MSILNMEKLLMLLKFQTAMMQYMIFGMYKNIINFLIQNLVKFKIVSLLTMIEHNLIITLYHETNTKTIENFCR